MATQVTLYVGPDGRLDPTTQVIDATQNLAPNGGTYVFNTLTRGVLYNVWIKLTYPAGKERVFNLGKTKRAEGADTTPPTVGNASLTRSITNPETALLLQVTVSVSGSGLVEGDREFALFAGLKVVLKIDFHGRIDFGRV